MGYHQRGRRGARILIIGLVGLLLAACGAQPAEPAAQTEQTSDAPKISEGGAVTVTATWLAPGEPSFEITLETHSVDLDGYDLAQLAVLRTDQGREVAAEVWDAPKGGHHRAGTLRFPATVDGMPVLGPEVRTITLIIRDVAGVAERRLEWTR